MVTDPNCPYLLNLPELFSLCKVLKHPELYDAEAEKIIVEARNENKVITRGSCSLFHREEAWDTRIFGMSVGKVELVLGSSRNDIDDCVDEFLRQNNYQYTLIRLSQHHINWIQAFEQRGAILLDTTVDMATLLPTSTGTKNEHIVNADQVGKEQLLECSDSFNLGRFFTDPDVKAGSVAYKEWVENSLTKKVADDVLVYLDEKKQVHGLITIKSGSLGKLKVLKIPLVVKHPKSTHSGISQKLLSAAFAHTKNDNYQAALISTQGDNIAAQLGYLSAGFRPYNTGVTMRFKATV